MNSSMLAGERRWASARRGGMTVLGKVTVPKPINLPSQRLENHGLDPDVEIVPKGTISWGSRSSSSGSNPWTASSSSPNADGGNVSPSHLGGRPSSGGSGTRPSTSGSEKTQDPAPNVWTSSSRPSSASGTLSSNQTSSSLRPRSAENRPNSSQLSRFAEPVSKTSAAWGSSATAEKLGVQSLKEDNFSLSSRDFPTLGSEKDNLVKNAESDCHPSSASDTVLAKEDNISHADIKHGTVNTWRAESSPHAEDDINPNMDKWQEDPHQYFNPNNAPQHFDGWRGPPMNGPPGGWYGGRPRGPAYDAHGAPGNFPMEPFPYYRPIPPLAGSQPVLPPGPRGPGPKNGDLYRAQMHEAYPRPGMPFRPNFYPRPPGSMPCEGYYGPPMGYCNNERDIPYMGMPTGPPVYNGYPAPPPDISNSHVRAAARGPIGKAMSEQMEMGHSEDTYGLKRVPLNSNNEYEQEQGHWEQNGPPNISQPGKSRFPGCSRRNEWGAEEDPEEATIAKRMAPSENPSNSYGNRIHPGDGMKVKSFGGTHRVKGVDDNRTNKSDGLSAFPSAVPHLLVSGEREAVPPATTKNPALMHKIDGLNAKFRVSDGADGSNSAYDRGEERAGPQIIDSRVANYTREVGNASVSSQRTPPSRNYAFGPSEVTLPIGDNPIQTIDVASRRSYHGGHPRGDNRGKGRFNSQDADGWRRKPLNTDSSSAITAPNNESTPNIHSHCPNYVGETSESSVVDPTGKIEGDSVEVSDSADIQAQRAKMREIAKQRALQLQMEEEERVREQKAKALAKLEELDRRKIAGEAANQKGERTPIIGDICFEQESHTIIGTVVAELKTNESGFNLVVSPAVAPAEADSSVKHAGKFIEVSKILVPVMHQKGLLESNVSHLPRNENSEDGSNKKVVSHSDDGGTSRHKRAGYKHKQNNMSQQSLNERTVSSTTSEVQKDHIHAAAIADMHKLPPSDTTLSDSNVLNAPSAVVESQRKRIYRSNKPKPKLDEDTVTPALPTATSDISNGNESIDNNGGSNRSVPNLGASVATLSEPDISVQTQEVSSSLPSEESQSKVSNQWKPHLSRRIPKNQQAHRFTDKHHGSDSVVWAPKAKGSDELSQTSVPESANSLKGNTVAQNSLKGKRAEMERYVPKPQLAQQGSAPALSLVSSSRSSEGAGVEQSGSAISATENVKSNLEMNVGDSNHNNNKKDHGTWRQCGSTDSSQMKGVHTDLRDSPQVKSTHTGPSPVFEPTNDSQQSKELVQFGTSEVNRGIAETNVAGGNHTSMDATTAAANKHPSARDQSASGRGKKHPPRGPRSGGNNLELENTSYSEVDGSSIQSSALDGNQMDKSAISKDTRASSHWQRKSSPNSANNQQGSRNAGSESVASDINRIPKKDNPQHKVQVLPQQDESSNTNQPFSKPGQYVNAKSNVADDSVARRNQDFDREKKPALAKGHPYSPNQDATGSGESPHTNMDDQNEHNVTPGSRRTGRPNNRPVRVHNSHREWSSGHDNKAHNPAFRERQRQNVHTEYQPVGPFKGHKPGKVDELGDEGADITGQKYRERGQFLPKRGGNFYRR